MNVRRPEGWARAAGTDAVSLLDEVLHREEIRRHKRAKMALATVAITLVLAATAGVLMMRGSASAADRAAAAPVRATRTTAVIASATVEVTSSAPDTVAPVVASSAPEPGNKKRAPSKRVAKPAVKAAVTTSKRQGSSSVQRVRIAIGVSGYVPSVVTASSNSPVILYVGRGQGCAAGFLIRKLGVNKDNSSGSVIVNLGRVAAGSYRFSCGMEMVTGTLIVK